MATPALISEQAALRRVATLVAQGPPPEQLFSAVIEEVGQLLDVEYAYMGRYEPGGTIAFVASWGPVGPHFRTGGRERVGGRNLVTRVFETGGSARTDSLADGSGPLGVAARELGVRSAVGAPILVEGRLWGVVIAGSTMEQPLPDDGSAARLVHRAGGDRDRECGQSCRARSACRRAGGVAPGRHARRARCAGGRIVRGGDRGDRDIAVGRVRVRGAV
jgi:hypothetical protein